MAFLFALSVGPIYQLVNELLLTFSIFGEVILHFVDQFTVGLPAPLPLVLGNFAPALRDTLAALREAPLRRLLPFCVDDIIDPSGNLVALWIRRRLRLGLRARCRRCNRLRVRDLPLLPLQDLLRR